MQRYYFFLILTKKQVVFYRAEAGKATHRPMLYSTFANAISRKSGRNLPQVRLQFAANSNTTLIM